MHHKIETANGCIDTDHCSVSLKLHFLPSNLHLHSHEICFASVFDSFTPLIMLNASRFMSSILLGNHLFGKHWPKHAWSFYIHRYTFYSQCSTLSTSTIKACLMQYIMIFHQIFMNVYNITDIHSLISNRKIMQGSLEPVFFLSTVKPFAILLKHNGYGFISEPFALNWWVFMLLTLSYLSGRIDIKYLASTVIVVSSNPNGFTPLWIIFFIWLHLF